MVFEACCSPRLGRAERIEFGAGLTRHVVIGRQNGGRIAPLGGGNRHGISSTWQVLALSVQVARNAPTLVLPLETAVTFLAPLSQ